MSLAPQEISVDRCHRSPTARAVQAVRVESLARSIAEIGLRQPINVRPHGDGFEIRGGGHRHAAFVKLGRATIPAFIRADDDLIAELAEIDENLIRNELSAIERDLAFARRKAIYEQLHPETAHGATGKGRPKSRHDGDSKPPPERFTQDAAKKTGAGERTIQRSVGHVETIGEQALAELIDTPLNATVELDALSQLDEARRQDVVERAKAGKDVSAVVELKKQRRAGREKALADRIRTFPDKRYGLLYVDVPRHFNVRADDTGLGKSPENHYPTMSFDELCALPIDTIAADDCLLIFWSTAASIIDDIEIMAEWGFVALRPRTGLGKLSKPNRVALAPVGAGAYRSMQVWDKVRIGLGYWFRDRHEFILIGARGNVVPPAQGDQDESLFAETKGKHSEKPDRVAAMIDRLWPNIPKIELFARQSRAGWDVWGLEAPEAPHDTRGIIEHAANGQGDPAANPATEDGSGDETQANADDRRNTGGDDEVDQPESATTPGKAGTGEGALPVDPVPDPGSEPGAGLDIPDSLRRVTMTDDEATIIAGDIEGHLVSLNDRLFIRKLRDNPDGMTALDRRHLAKIAAKVGEGVVA